ncbi:concanavalin A-like lectin/glucanase domain-containing protein, partial [Mycena latifolia]
VQWSETARFLGGKGWATGSNRNIEYSSDYSQSSGNSRLSLYGLTKDPLVEYRIVEDFRTSDQFSNLRLKGTVISEGAVYSIYEAQRVNESGMNFSQYWSVRQSPHSAGYITTGNHFTAWAALGMPLGEFESQFVALESDAGSGAAAVGVLAVSLQFSLIDHVFCLTGWLCSSARWSTRSAGDNLSLDLPVVLLGSLAW